MIVLKNVCKTYGKRPIIDNVTLQMTQGGFTSLVGPNGAGKSTLLAMISRLTAMDSGSISVDGMDIQKTPGRIFAQKLAVLRQENSINCRLTVRELVSFGRYPHSQGRLTPDDEIHIENAIRYLELEPHRQSFLDELSGGQRQRAFIAMVLCQNTDYILLDEPLNNLDIKYTAAMMKLLRRAVEELRKTVIVVLHDINCAAYYSDTVIAMRQGKILAQGSPAEIINSDCLRAVYDIDSEVTMIDGRPTALYYK